MCISIDGPKLLNSLETIQNIKYVYICLNINKGKIIMESYIFFNVKLVLICGMKLM